MAGFTKPNSTTRECVSTLSTTVSHVTVCLLNHPCSVQFIDLAVSVSFCKEYFASSLHDMVEVYLQPASWITRMDC